MNGLSAMLSLNQTKKIGKRKSYLWEDDKGNIISKHTSYVEAVNNQPIQAGIYHLVYMTGRNSGIEEKEITVT